MQSALPLPQKNKIGAQRSGSDFERRSDGVSERRRLF